jgi:hypothetical protein
VSGRSLAPCSRPCATADTRPPPVSVARTPNLPRPRTASHDDWRGGFDFASIPAHAPSRGAAPPRPLPISSPGDTAEREADYAAERVMRGDRVTIAPARAPTLVRHCAACEAEDRDPSSNVRLMPFGDAPLAGRAPPAVAAALRAPGRPLDTVVRAAFEPRFGTSFADVRVHADAAADAAARAIGARAFTLGRRIAFAEGAYAPETPAGRHLLAHELAHVAQHGDGSQVIARSPAIQADKDLLELANRSPIEISGRGFPQFDALFSAARRGLIDLAAPEEMERQMRFQARQGSREFAAAWSQEELWDYAQAEQPEKARMLQAKWNGFVQAKYFDLLGSKAQHWETATRRMATAAFIGNVVGGVSVASASFFAGAGLGLGAAGAPAEGLAVEGASLEGVVAREGARAVLKKEVEVVVRRSTEEAAMKAAQLAKYLLPDPETDKDERKRKRNDRCALWGLPPGVEGGARLIVQRPSVRGQTTVDHAAFRLDAGVEPSPGQDATKRSQRWVKSIGCRLDQAGHVIAKRFGGSGDCNGPAGNIFPQDSNINGGNMRDLEAVMARTHKAGADVCMLIQLSYEPEDSLRPTHAAAFSIARHPGHADFVPLWDTIVRNESSDPDCTA